MNCEEVEGVVFTTTTRRATDEEAESTIIAPLDASGEKDGQSGDGEGTEAEDGGVRLPSHMAPPTATTGKPKSEQMPRKTPGELGMQKAKERELVRRAARRGVAFGFDTPEGKRRSVEAVQRGRVVESSFAKGEWGVKMEGMSESETASKYVITVLFGLLECEPTPITDRVP